MWKAYAPVASGPRSASSGVSPASAPSRSASARLASSEGPPPGVASKTGATRSARPREAPSDSKCTSIPSSRSSTRDARESSACAGTPSRASAISIARLPVGVTPARRQATPAVQPAGALPARTGPSARTSPRATIPVLPASMASTAARSGANKRIQSHAEPLAFAARAAGRGAGRDIVAKSAAGLPPDAVKSRRPATRPARRCGSSAIQDATILFALPALRTGAISPAPSREKTSILAPREARPHRSVPASRSTPTRLRSVVPTGSGASDGAYFPAFSSSARRPDASSTESTMSADAGTSTAARRSGSKLLRELRSGPVRGESERLCLLPRPPRHRPAHVAVAEHQRGEQGRQRRSHRPPRMGSQEAPDGASRRGEEVSVPEQRPDAAAERESEDVREEEEDHPAAPRHGKDVLLRFSHGGGA